MTTSGSYPVELIGGYGTRVNRFLWLIKWILLIPHYVILLAVSLPALITTPISWLAVIILGRYPSFLRAYHTGLLRWGWRVDFYSYEAGSTDRYPPFSFRSQEGYPADLIIDYPEISSRLTGLFRWLLAIPHWIVISVLARIVGILVFLALAIALFTGRYPEALFNIIMGINRWRYRAMAYIWLLVDKYPPFSFD